jgi:phosphoribosylaminoimidazolecarboxamide formyltransferase/IMP cyclohydrolase
MSLHPLSSLPETPLTIHRALLSVSDKAGLLPLAQTLHKHGIALFSTGGTAQTIRSAGIPVKDISEVTGFPECLDGRVKTLHPSVHAGILARTSHEPDNEGIKALGIEPFELVVVNLYPFSKTVASGTVTAAVATEFIDIGGPTMIRAAAKNFAHVAILSDPSQYEAFSFALDTGKAIPFEMRRSLARAAFHHTAAYDQAISAWFDRDMNQHDTLSLREPRFQTLRYGENPHQQAAVYGKPDNVFTCLHGKELSYNNYLDIDASLGVVSGLSDHPACAIIKHTNPCGVALGTSPLEAWERAFRADKVSPFGGIIVFNREVDLATAEAVDAIFSEIILAPSFEEAAFIKLQKKANRRLIVYKPDFVKPATSLRSIIGGYLVQDSDLAPVQPHSWKTVTKRTPTAAELTDMTFAWHIVRWVKSNAIVFAKDGQTLGIGGGQTSRVDASEIAVRKAGKEMLSLHGSVVASDAFFPFADGILAAAEAGATAIIQPGGSVRDAEAIEAADRHNIAMIFTGLRHFRH